MLSSALGAGEGASVSDLAANTEDTPWSACHHVEPVVALLFQCQVE